MKIERYLVHLMVESHGRLLIGLAQAGASWQEPGQLGLASPFSYMFSFI
jgi:hypothetical protein